MDSEPVVLSQQEILDASQSQNWGELWVDLLTHTIKRLKYRYGIKERAEQLKQRGRAVLSGVMDTILIKGDRHWNTERYVTFRDFVESVIDSELSNQFSKKKSLERAVEVLPEVLQADNIEDDVAYDELKQRVYTLLEQQQATDEELLVFGCMADGIVKPMHIRNELGIDAVAFRRIWRNLNAKLETIQHHFSTNG